MDHGQANVIVSFIWGIADDVLRDVHPLRLHTETTPDVRRDSGRG